MHIDMAGRTAGGNQPRIWHGALRHVADRQQSARVTCLGMALLTQDRAGGCQQAFKVRAMRRVAVEAAVPDRGMLKQERSTLLRMTGKADLVDAVGLQQGCCA